MRKLLRASLTLLVILSHSTLVDAQMLVDTDTLYGNEWINYDQPYYKIPIAKDGLYKLDANALQAAGIALSEVSGNQLRLFYMGAEIPIHVSTDGALSGSDFLLFWGMQNRGEFDTHLFEDPEENQLNPRYSLVTDTSAYYLTWGSTNTSTRLETIATDLTNAPPKEDWIWQRTGEVFTEKFMKNYTRRSGITIYFSHYDVAEGYGNRNINELLQSGNTSQDFSLDLPDAFIGGPNARFTSRFGVGEGDHRQIVQIDGGTYFDRTYNDIAVKAPDFSFPLTDDQIDIHFEGQADDRDEQSIAYYQVDYPSLPDARNQKILEFEVDGNANPIYLEIADFNSSSGSPIIYDLTYGLRILCQYENGLVKAILPAGADRRSLVLLEETSAVSPSSLETITFSDLLSQETEFLILTAPELRETYENQDQVQAYADYRASAAGGNYKTQIVEVEDIYQQFGYGLDRHPQSIRNFVHAAHRRWPKLKYVFIIGKGREYPSLRTAEGLANALEAETLFVPSFGFPASDNLMLSNNTSSVAVVPVGRIAATTPKEVNIYLRKVETLEATVNNGQTIEERAWMKNIMHLGGGTTSGEQNAIKSNLERMANEVEGNLFGGRVTPFYKFDSDPIEQSRSQQIFDRINEGTAVITFFGHSSPGTFDFNIDNPDNYENFGKFPLIMSLGCYSGNFFTSSKGIAERFTFYEDKASVAFGASRGVGFISTLGGFADRFYEKMGGEKYGQGIGDIISATRESFDYLTGLEIKTIVQQFSLMGDPSVRLHPAPGPDYVVDRSSVQFSPKVISIQEDSFQLEFEVLNLGQFIQDSITVDIRQKLPGGEEFKVKSLRIATPAYASHHAVNLPTQGKASIGLNTFFIDADVQNEVDELPAPSGEMNNSLVRADGQAGVNLFIVDNTARPVYPPKFALVGSAPVTLKSCTSDALAPDRKYLLEIDTTHLFDSPLKERTEIVQRGGVIKWTPSLPLQDSTVYYWRISPDSTEAEIGYVWESSSFTYIEGSPNGWGQGHWGQWLEGDLSEIQVTPDNGFTFINDFKDLFIRSKIRTTNPRPEGYVNGKRWSDFFRWELPESINIVVIDELGNFWFNYRPGEYGSQNRRTAPIACYPFSTASIESRRKIIEFIEEVVPDNHTIIFYTAIRTTQYDLQVDEWEMDSLLLEGKNLYNVIEDQGGQLIRSLKDEMRPYIFSFVKNGGVLGEKIAESISGEVNYEISIEGFWYEGRYTSPEVGPARSFERLSWNYSIPTSADTIQLDLIGIDREGEETFLLKDISVKDSTLSWIDAARYPSLKLRFDAADRVENSCPPLFNWSIIYEGLPDATFAGSLSAISDTVLAGSTIFWEYEIENTSQFSLDSLLVRFTLSQVSGYDSVLTRRFQPIPPQGRIPITFQFDNTENWLGVNSLKIEINPNNDQLESNYQNNILVKEFFVDRDHKQPVLDVTFDGLHILEGELISSEPEIIIKLIDENEFLLLRDTSLFRLELRSPDGTISRIPLSGVQFLPATVGKNNEASIVWEPRFTENGTYEFIVKAKDASGNRIGALDFSTQFEVITEKTVSNVLNYPNPFSSSTRFVYTLTGAVPPSQFMIRIMTVNGQIVREIGLDELGPLRIGTHMTEFAWDGRDQYGDLLANGVYLFQVDIKDDQGVDFEKLENGTSKYFRNGIGKMVLLR